MDRETIVCKVIDPLLGITDAPLTLLMFLIYISEIVICLYIKIAEHVVSEVFTRCPLWYQELQLRAVILQLSTN